MEQQDIHSQGRNIALELFAADLNRDTPTLDLHGKPRGEALDELRFFLETNRRLEEAAVRIIHGRGEGILRRAVHDALVHAKHTGKVLEFRESDDPSQTGAVTIALLTKNEVQS